MINKLLQFVGGAIIIIVLYGGLRFLLVPTKPATLKTWEACKTELLENWAGSHPNQVMPLLSFTADHASSFRGESPTYSFDDHDSRGTAVSDAQKLGIGVDELIKLDRRIAKECGPFPKS